MWLRRISLIVVALLCLSVRAEAQAYVTNCDGASFAAGTTTTCTYAANITTGHKAIIATCNNEAQTVSTVTDSASNTYTSRSTFSASNTRCAVYDSQLTNGNGTTPTVTITWSGSLSLVGVVMGHTVSGLDTGVAFEAGAWNSGCFPSEGTDTVVSGTFSTTTASDYIFASAWDFNGGTNSFTVGTGYTLRISNTTTTMRSTEDAVQGSPGSTTVPFSIPASGPSCYAIFGGGWKVPGGGGGGGTTSNLLLMGVGR
jgi:hypothetical protein